jgi:hypothetical protein
MNVSKETIIETQWASKPKGYRLLMNAEVAKEFGVSKGALYNNVKSLAAKGKALKDTVGWKYNNGSSSGQVEVKLPESGQVELDSAIYNSTKNNMNEVNNKNSVISTLPGQVEVNPNAALKELEDYINAFPSTIKEPMNAETIKKELDKAGVIPDEEMRNMTNTTLTEEDIARFIIDNNLDAPDGSYVLDRKIIVDAPIPDFVFFGDFLQRQRFLVESLNKKGYTFIIPTIYERDTFQGYRVTSYDKENKMVFITQDHFYEIKKPYLQELFKWFDGNDWGVLVWISEAQKLYLAVPHSHIFSEDNI